MLPINRVFSAKGIVTGKLFEYLATGNPVLGIGPVDGDAAAILRDTAAGEMIDFDDGAGMVSYVKTLYSKWVAGESLAGSKAAAVARYSRSGLTEQLAAILDNLVAGKES